MLTLKIPQTDVNLQYYYHIPARNLKNTIQKSFTQLSPNKNFKIIQRDNPVMFLRSPKHFKRGKQHIFFYKNTLKYRVTLNGFVNPHTIVYTKSHNTIFNLLKTKAPQIYINAIELRRISVFFKVILKF